MIGVFFYVSLCLFLFLYLACLFLSVAVCYLLSLVSLLPLPMRELADRELQEQPMAERAEETADRQAARAKNRSVRGNILYGYCSLYLIDFCSKYLDPLASFLQRSR